LSLAVYPEECGNAPVDYKMPAMVAILTACHCLQGGSQNSGARGEDKLRARLRG